MRRLGPLLAATTLLFALWAPAAAAAAPAHRTSLTEMEYQVMCPICGTLLALSDSPQANREKAFIAHLIAEGKTKSQVEDALVEQYGEAVLALPGGSGFDLSAYLVPLIGFAIAAAALGLGVLRWRRAGSDGGSGAGPAVEGPKGEDAERLEADIARYDL